MSLSRKCFASSPSVSVNFPVIERANCQPPVVALPALEYLHYRSYWKVPQRRARELGDLHIAVTWVVLLGIDCHYE